MNPHLDVLSRPRWACSPTAACFAVWLSVIGSSVSAYGQAETKQVSSQETSPAEPSAAAPEITEQLIDTRRKEVENAKDLSEEVRMKVLDLYRQAAESLQQSKEFAAKAEEFKNKVATVDERVKAAKAELETLKTNQQVQLPSALPDLEQMLSQKQTELETLKKEQAQYEGESARRVARRKEIRERLISAPERLAEIKRQLETPSPADEPAGVTTARKTALAARKQALEKELGALKQEIDLYDAEEAVEWVRLQRELKAQQIARTEQTVKRLTDRVNELRRQEAAKKLAQARREKYRTHPSLRSYAEGNEALAKELQNITKPIEEAKAELQRAQQTFDELQKQFDQTKTKVESVGRLTAPIGHLLRQQRRSETLQNALAYRSRVEAHAEKSDEIHFQLLKYDDDESDLFREKPDLVAKVLQETEPRLTDEQRQELVAGLTEQERAELKQAPVETLTQQQKLIRAAIEQSELKQAADEILTNQQELLSTLVRSYKDYYETLVNLHIRERDLVQKANEYIQYIDEKVLWIRSDQPLSLSGLQADVLSQPWFVSGEAWRQIGNVLWTDMKETPVTWISALILFGSLLYLRRRLRAELKEIGQQARRSTFFRFGPTLRAGFLTAIVSVPVPGLLAYLAWRLSEAGTELDSAQAVAQGFSVVASIFLPLEFVRQSCKPAGLAEAHFHWSSRIVRLLRTNLRWATVIGLPLVFATATLHAGEAEQGWNTLERIAFILFMVLLAALIHRLLHPVRGVLSEWIAYNRGGWVDRLKYIWYSLAVLVPLTFAGLAWAGYYYTAGRLTWRLVLTTGLILLLVYFRAFLRRWVLVNRRRLSIEQARERRAAAQEGDTPSVEATEAMAATNVEEPGTDLDTISTQMQRLVGVGLAVAGLIGLWFVWSDVLPALNILNRWPIWHTTGADGTTLEPVTVAHLALAVFIGVLTGVAARNVPGLMEMSLLQQLPLDNSIRYAITRLASYAIVLAGVFFGFGMIGIGWSNVQWLAAALTFGLGFGLQEIFANFVSGLIILFERPMRVGDVITIGDVTGWVSRIRIRATTITRFDRRELVVPNREFITGQLLNWTLSNSIYRPELTVGLAYGSDVEKARQLMLKIVKEHPIVLDDPPPLINFEAFGDSTLNVVLRPYFPNLDNMLPTINDLNTRIHDEFKKAGIEIAFPQRDLHLRSVPEFLAFNGRGDGPEVRDQRSEVRDQRSEIRDQGTEVGTR